MITKTTIYVNSTTIAFKATGNKNNNAIIFLHGNSQNADTWLPQLQNDELNNNYYLLAVDLPGHGRSAWLKNKEDYRPGKLAITVSAIISQLKIKKYILVGLSYGTNIIGEIRHEIKGCKGIFLASVCIVNDLHTAASIITPGNYGHVVTDENPSDYDIKNFAYDHISNKSFADSYVKSYKETDPAFRRQLSAALMENDLTDEHENIQQLNLPVCIAFGENETLLNNSYLDDFKPVWNNKVHLIKNAGHLLNKENPAAFNVLLKAFADDVFK